MQQQKRIEKYQFSLKRLLGQGSYASVYRGKVIETGEPVAVKVIDKRIFTSSFNLKNLHCEIDIMKRVSHSNIVQLHDVFQTSNNMYIVTQLCDFDLYHYLKEKRKLGEEQAISLLKQIIKGIKYLHQHNIIHRDLKPANILMKDKQCKLSDFGFAKNVENQNVFLKSIVGTPLYMSPQLLQKQKYTNKSDLWSVGLIFYEMLHGKTPWLANNEMQLISAIHTQKVSYSKLISDLSKDFISRCLAVKEDDRISWEEAFQHPLVRELEENFTIPLGRIKRTSQLAENKSKVLENKSKVLENKSKVESTRMRVMQNRSAILHKQAQFDLQNNSHLANFNQTMNPKESGCTTPKLHKNISELKLKKVQALTPKSSFSNINNKLKQVWALNPKKDKNQEQRKKRNLTIQYESKEMDR